MLRQVNSHMEKEVHERWLGESQARKLLNPERARELLEKCRTECRLLIEKRMGAIREIETLSQQIHFFQSEITALETQLVPITVVTSTVAKTKKLNLLAKENLSESELLAALKEIRARRAGGKS